MFTRPVLRYAAVTAIAVTLAACGSSGSSNTGSTASGSKSTTVNVGTATPVKVTGAPKIALINVGTGNPYADSLASGAEAAAQAEGYSLQVFNGNFDPQTQFDLAQSIISGHKFNAIIIHALDGPLMCNILTKTAPAAGIVVVNIEEPLCGRDLDAVTNVWSPGTVAQVGVESTEESFQGQVKACLSHTTGQQNVAILNADSAEPVYKEMTQAWTTEAASSPKVKIVANETVQYTPASGFSTMQDILQAHPDVNLVEDVDASDVSPGAIRAIDAAGKKGKVTVCDIAGGSTISSADIKSGAVALDEPYYPTYLAKAAILTLKAAFAGKIISREIYENNDGNPVAWHGQFLYVDKANFNDYPSY